MPRLRLMYKKPQIWLRGIYKTLILSSSEENERFELGKHSPARENEEAAARVKGAA
jgi:hypothetical protein